MINVEHTTIREESPKGVISFLVRGKLEIDDEPESLPDDKVAERLGCKIQPHKVSGPAERAKNLAHAFAKAVGGTAKRFTNDYRGESAVTRKTYSGWYVEMDSYDAEFRDNGRCGLSQVDPDHGFDFCAWDVIKLYADAMKLAEASVHVACEVSK